MAAGGTSLRTGSPPPLQWDVMQEHGHGPALVFHPSPQSIVHFGPFRLDLADGVLCRGDDELRLPPRAMAILQHLVERAGRIVSKTSLMDVAWKDANVSETSLIEAIGLIRHALGDDPQKPAYIQTVHRRGYRFIAPITPEPPASTPDPHEHPQPADGSSVANDVEATVPPASDRLQRGIVAGLVAAVVFLLLGGMWAWLVRCPEQDKQVARVNVAFPSEEAPVPSLNSHPIVALSPDGERFVYVGGAPGNTKLFLREMNRFDAIPLPATEGAHGPFFSPDGDWVAFFAQGSLKKVRVTGEDHPAPQVLCAAQTGVGGAWVSANEIVFAPN